MVSCQELRFGHRWLPHVAILLQTLLCSLLVYSLLVRFGDIVDSGCQRFGFYNYCLYNITLEDCHCITNLEELSLAGGPAGHGLVLAILLTYSSLVTVTMALLAITFAHCFQDNHLWKFARLLDVLSLAGLSLGMATYLSLTWNLLDFSQVTSGFLALLAAAATLPGLCGILRRCTDLNMGVSKCKTVSTDKLL